MRSASDFSSNVSNRRATAGSGTTAMYVSIFRAYCSPLIAIIGITGNMLVIFVFSKERKRSRFSIYCMMLSGVHIVILLTNSFFDDFLGRGLVYLSNGTYFKAKLDIKSSASCKLMEYVPNAAYLASSLIVIIFSCDRVLTIFHPLKYISIHFQSWAWSCTGAAVLLSCILNTCNLIIYTIFVSPQHGISKSYIKCDIPSIYSRHFLEQFSLYLKVVCAFVLPNFLIIILNFVIFFKLWRIQITRCKLLPHDSKGNNLEMSRVVGHLAVSSCFILLTMPLVIVMILRMQFDALYKNKNYAAYGNVLKHLSRLFSSFKDINYASDFFLYIIFLPNFRWRFCRYACRLCRRKRWFKATKWGQKFEHNVHKFDSSMNRRKMAFSTHGQYSPNVEKYSMNSFRQPYKIIERSTSKDRAVL